MGKVCKFLCLILIIVLFPKNVLAEEKAVYWDVSIGGENGRTLIDYLKYNRYLSGIGSVKSIFFDDVSRTGNTISSNAIDISRDNDGTVYASVDNTVLYIQYEGTLYFNEDSSDLFSNNKNITAIFGLEYVNTSKVENMSHMFFECTSLNAIDVSSFDTSSVKDMSYMFYMVKSTSTLDVSNFDTSNVENMSYMFYGCEGITKLDLSTWNTSKVTDMSYMFGSSKTLMELDLSSFDTSNVIDMSYMFYNMDYLTKLDVSSFNTENVTNMRWMFYADYVLSNLDLSSFDTKNVTDMSYMFAGCNNLLSLDVSSFDTSNVENMSYMFYGLEKIKELKLSNFNTKNVIDMGFMFGNMQSLEKLDVSTFDTSKVTTMEGMFFWVKNLTSLDLSGWNTPNLTNMKQMFVSVEKLQELDLSSFDTSKVTDMSHMFYNAKSLTLLNLDGWNTSNVTTMEYMFIFCYSLTELDLSSFDTKNVTTMEDMFYSLSNLKELDLSNFNTENVTNMKRMFSDMVSLEKLDISNFDTSKVTTMEYMFYWAKSLKELDVSSFNTSNVEYMYGMFENCESLVELDVSNFDLSSVKSLEYMFSYCFKLEKIYVFNDWKVDTSKVKTNFMFSGSTNLTDILGNKYDYDNYCDDICGAKIGRKGVIGYFSIKGSLTSDEYDLSKKYIYLSNKEFEIDLVKVENLTKKYEDNALYIYYGDLLINSYDIVKVTSSLYEIYDDYIFMGDYEINHEKIEVTNGYVELLENNVLIYYDNQIIKRLPIKTNIKEIILEFAHMNMKIGNSIKVAFIIYPEYFIGDDTITWTSDNEKIATVDKDGNVTAVGIGRTIIRARSANGKEAGVTVDVPGMYEVDDSLLLKDKMLVIKDYNNKLEDIKGKIKFHYQNTLDYRLYDSDYKYITGEMLSTGNFVEIFVDNLEKNEWDYQYQVSLRGDLSGDGDIDSLDLAAMMNHISEKKVLDGVFMEAGYLNNDEDIDSLDLAYLMNHIAGKEGY